MSLGATPVIGVDAADAPMPHRSHPLPDGCRLSETMKAFGVVLDDPMMERLVSRPRSFTARSDTWGWRGAV